LTTLSSVLVVVALSRYIIIIYIVEIV